MLSRFPKAERERVDASLERAADAAVKMMDDMAAAMNEYNKKVAE